MQGVTGSSPVDRTISSFFENMNHLLLTLIFFFSLSAKAELLPLPAEKLKDSKQLIWVESTPSFQTTVRLFEIGKSGWQEVNFAKPAVIGKGGFAKFGEKREGDKKTPQGLFTLGMLFSKHELNVKSSVTRLTKDDKWIDDKHHPDYNKWIRGETSAKSYENLLLTSQVYDYIQVIDYNMNPIVPGNGSAIFLHIWVSKILGTLGCVALDRSDVEYILKWLDPSQKPQILLGQL